MEARLEPSGSGGGGPAWRGPYARHAGRPQKKDAALAGAAGRAAAVRRDGGAEPKLRPMQAT